MICLAGSGTVKIAGNEYNLGQFDAIYIPRDSMIAVSTKTTVDFAEFSAGVEGNYPLQVVRYGDVAKDPGLKFVAGGPGSRRELNVLVANNVEAGRLIAGFTSSDPGNWTSCRPTSTPQCWKRCMCTLTCRSQPMACSWYITTRNIRNW
jgi:5-deoxy-glucuronate isomerase